MLSFKIESSWIEEYWHPLSTRLQVLTARYVLYLLHCQTVTQEYNFKFNDEINSICQVATKEMGAGCCRS